MTLCLCTHTYQHSHMPPPPHTHTHTTPTPVDSSSSYGGDSEDSDWAPPDQNSEDVKELVAEATSFISNKKMRKPT